VRAALKGLDSDGRDLRDVAIDDAECFGLNLTASIGPADDDGAELFQLTACTARWLAEQDLPKGFAFQRHTLLLQRWDPDLVARAVADLCRHTEGATWNEVATKLSRFAYWEFEDYR
jgi:hypothetical protein